LAFGDAQVQAGNRGNTVEMLGQADALQRGSVNMSILRLILIQQFHLFSRLTGTDRKITPLEAQISVCISSNNVNI
jgi:hypothetical protein